MSMNKNSSSTFLGRRILATQLSSDDDIINQFDPASLIKAFCVKIKANKTSFAEGPHVTNSSNDVINEKITKIYVYANDPVEHNNLETLFFDELLL